MSTSSRVRRIAVRVAAMRRNRLRRQPSTDTEDGAEADIPDIDPVPVRRARIEEPDIQPIDVESVADLPTCIDLTEADEAGESDDDVVDLTNANATSVIESPIVILSSTSDNGRSTRSRTRVVSLDEDDEDVSVFDISSAGDDTSIASVEGAAIADTSTTSTPGHGVTCPVCFDKASRIKSTGRRLMSTTCGHIFCSDCITNSIAAQKKCPSCRKKLSLKQVHPIFI